MDLPDLARLLVAHGWVPAPGVRFPTEAEHERAQPKPPPPPDPRCRHCGRLDHWTHADGGEPKCATCHPRPERGPRTPVYPGPRPPRAKRDKRAVRRPPAWLTALRESGWPGAVEPRIPEPLEVPGACACCGGLAYWKPVGKPLRCVSCQPPDEPPAYWWTAPADVPASEVQP